MAIVTYKGARCSVLQTETVAMPDGATEIETEVSQMKFVLQFVTGVEAGFKVEAEQRPDSSVLFRFHGSPNPLGSAFDVRVGDIGGKSLVLSVIVHGIGEKVAPPKLVSFSFLLEV